MTSLEDPRITGKLNSDGLLNMRFSMSPKTTHFNELQDLVLIVSTILYWIDRNDIFFLFFQDGLFSEF